MCSLRTHPSSCNPSSPGSRLQLLHGSDVGGLDVVLELGKLLLELVERDLLVLNDQVDLELADTVSDWDEFGTTPDKTVLLDGTNALLEFLHVGLVICSIVSVYVNAETCKAAYPMA